MTDGKTTFERFTENPTGRRIFEQERLIVDATELLSIVIARSGTKRAELAEKLGRSKAYVTQMLRGNQNLTLRTLADVFCVLNCRLLVAAEPFAPGMGVIPSRQWNMKQTAPAVENEYAPSDDLIGGIAA